MEEKSEEPTPKRIEDARRKGQVARSRDLGGAAVLAASFGSLAAGGAAWVGGLAAYLAVALREGTRGMTPTAAVDLAGGALVRALALPLGAALLAALGVGLLQTRFLFSPAAVRPDLGRLSPAASLPRLFGPAAMVEMGKGLLKVALVGAVAFATLRPHLGDVVGLAGRAPAHAAGALGTLARTLGLRVALVALALGGADYLLQWARHRKSMRMTRDEVKREQKEAEGDPHHKAARQRLAREILEQRMVEDVRKADFVVVNPDHVAVALSYDRGADAAPVVVAKGERLLAERIKEVAREAGVPIFREVTLARSLRDVEEGDEIPEALYQAVAEILRVVYGEESRVASPAATTRPVSPGAGWRRA